MLATEKRAVALVSGIAITRLLGLFMLLPVISLWASNMQRATPLLIGLAVGGYGLTQAALQIPFGRLSDRLGRRPVVIGGLLIFIAGSLLCASAESIEWLIVGRIVQGAGAVSAALTAWIADASRPEVRVRATAILGASIGLAYVVAMLLGPLLAAAMSVNAIFLLSAGLGGTGVLLALSTPVAPITDSAEPSLPLAALLRVRGVVSLIAQVYLLHTVLIALFIVLPFMLRELLGLASTSHWQVYLVGVLGSLVLVLPMLRQSERQDARSWLLLPWLLMAAGLALFALMPTVLGVVMLAAVLFFAGFNVLEATLPARVSLVAPTGSRGAVMGIYATFHFLGAFSGGVLGGLLLGIDAADSRFWVLVALAVATTLVAGLRGAALNSSKSANF